MRFKGIEDMRSFQLGRKSTCKPLEFVVLWLEFQRKWWNAIHTETKAIMGFKLVDRSSLANKYVPASAYQPPQSIASFRTCKPWPNLQYCHFLQTIPTMDGLC